MSFSINVGMCNIDLRFCINLRLTSQWLIFLCWLILLIFKNMLLPELSFYDINVDRKREVFVWYKFQTSLVSLRMIGIVYWNRVLKTRLWTFLESHTYQLKNKDTGTKYKHTIRETCIQVWIQVWVLGCN